MKGSLQVSIALTAIVAAYQAVGWANGVSIPSAPSPSAASRPGTPEEMAVEAYNSGIARRDRAIKAETQAVKDKKESDRLKNQKKAREEYRRRFRTSAMQRS